MRAGPHIATYIKLDLGAGSQKGVKKTAELVYLPSRSLIDKGIRNWYYIVRRPAQASHGAPDRSAEFILWLCAEEHKEGCRNGKALELRIYIYIYPPYAPLCVYPRLECSPSLYQTQCISNSPHPQRIEDSTVCAGENVCHCGESWMGSVVI